ncbi:copper-translocating P-type ATPase [Asticcacaulis biprosthecium C19]|uniref:Copper-translocating P-type ATPase n=1 Tax=Asticcacaulis biprosthecium C19 TaxID=715226 RepID=F4QTG8_9CAUL|nr:heavy metal translocating P-type ATPase [Asticcacaulis biprosthecium]EGF90038.1 copper-translocating P-type ATPase [Asticcacaulis biprosthecium C19]
MNLATDFSCFTHEEDGRRSLYMQIEGMRCATCAWKIEQALTAHAGVEARVNFSTQRLRVTWPDTAPGHAANDFAGEIEALGFHVAPFDPDSRAAAAKAEERELLTCLAVAAFATAAIMLFADALWFARDLEGPSRDLMHWLMGLIAMPATLYCGRPFFRSALGALRHGRTNMDVPISLAVILANALSLFETVRHGQYVYFDASVMLLFFLLIGRYLDLKARGKAREAAQGLLAMLEGTARVIRNGRSEALRIRDIRPGDTLIVAAGEKIAADGVVVSGTSDIDTRLVTGETLPRPATVGDRLYAGMINQSAPLQVEVAAAADNSLLSEIVALMEKAEQSQSAYVRFADRVAALYAPVVHVLALATFVGWVVWGYVAGPAVAWEEALLKAMAVLIITCPCALGLAVPVVHVLASSHLFARGVLVKSGKGLEVLAGVDTVVFDKTGTLTRGAPQWLNPHVLPEKDRRLAVAMAAHSQHPLSQAVASADYVGSLPDMTVTDHPGQGLDAVCNGESLRLGSGAWLGVPDSGSSQLELWFRRGQQPAIRLAFADVERSDAADTISLLKRRGFRVLMLSGDRPAVADALGVRLGIDEVRAGLSPVDKVAAIDTLQGEGRKVLMVGDGLNDAAALSAAQVSMSPSSGMDITQNAADFVYRGEGLMSVVTAIDIARLTRVLVAQNFALSLVYNLVAVPAAIFGFVTPLIAAIAMSSSSLVVVANSLRLKLFKD